jgi:hypothetical protein
MNKVEADFKNALFVLMCVVAVVAVVFGLTADGTAKPTGRFATTGFTGAR